MPEERPRIEHALGRDLPAIYEICLRTAAAGQDATGLYGDREWPGQFWSAPYALFEPDLAFVLREGDRAVGYVVGARDTAAFQARLDREWWPALRRRYADYVATSEHDAEALRRLAEPEGMDPRLAGYPAHLHINLLPGSQRGGWGRRMVERELDALASVGARAVHLGVSMKNAPVMAFYEKLGFEEIFRTAKAIYMGRTLPRR